MPGGGRGGIPLFSLKEEVSPLRLWFFGVLIPKQISPFSVFNSLSFWANSLKRELLFIQNTSPILIC